jgi:LacI family fructose operon transcriptional repressor
MIVPMHDNRFFSGMSQAFERLARERHWYPIVVSTLRDPALEVETVNTLISYRIEYLVVAGATDPDSVSRLCASHGVAHVNVDLPGTRATSVISDNYWGAQQLTRALIERSKPVHAARRDKPYFVGGIATDYATRRRMDGFADAVRAHFGRIDAEQIDPFASVLTFPVLMVRQNVEGLLGEAFRIIDSKSFAERQIIEIKPELVFMREDETRRSATAARRRS